MGLCHLEECNGTYEKFKETSLQSANMWGIDLIFKVNEFEREVGGISKQNGMLIAFCRNLGITEVDMVLEVVARVTGELSRSREGSIHKNKGQWCKHDAGITVLTCHNVFIICRNCRFEFALFFNRVDFESCGMATRVVSLAVFMVIEFRSREDMSG